MTNVKCFPVQTVDYCISTKELLLVMNVMVFWYLLLLMCSHLVICMKMGSVFLS
jgi:hypothetical protein